MLEKKFEKIKIPIIKKKISKIIKKDEKSTIYDCNFEGLKKSLKGKNNTFFLINDSNNEILQHYDINYQTRFNPDNFIKSIESKKEYVENLNKTYNIFVVPDKSIILRKYLPFETTEPERHVNHLKDYLYDLNEIITEEDVLKNDTHISESSSPKITSYILSKVYDKPEEYFKKELESKIVHVNYKHNGDLFNESNWSYKKDNYYYENKFTPSSKIEVKSDYEEISLEKIPEEFRYMSKRQSYYYVNENAILDKKALILHDSTTVKLMKTFIAAYKEVFFYWDHWFFNKELIDWFNPDDIIEIRTERFLENALTPIINEKYFNRYPCTATLEKFSANTDEMHLQVKVEDLRRIKQSASIKIFLDEKNIKNDKVIDGTYTTSIDLTNYEHKTHNLRIEVVDMTGKTRVIKKNFPLYESLENEFKDLKSCYKGENNTFFKVNDKNNELRQHYDRMYKNRINIKEFNDSIASKKTYLNEKDISYYVYAIPDKSVVLSKYIPFNNSEAKRIIEQLNYVNDLKQCFDEKDFLKNDTLLDMKSTIKAVSYILNSIFQKDNYEEKILERVDISKKKHNGLLFTNNAWSYEKDDLYHKYYSIETSDVNVKSYSEVENKKIPQEFREFAKVKSKYYKNENPIIDKKVLILSDMSITPFIPTFVASFNETFFYFDKWFFNKDLIDYLKPDIVLEIRQESEFENPISQRVSVIHSIKVPINVNIENLNVEDNCLNIKLNVIDLKSLVVNTKCKFFIDEKEASTADITDIVLVHNIDISYLNKGEHLLKILVEEQTSTKAKIVERKFIK